MAIRKAWPAAVAAAGVTLLLEGCGSEKKQGSSLDLDCDHGCKPQVVCDAAGTKVTVPAACTNKAYLSDVKSMNETQCNAWVKAHSGETEKKAECAKAMQPTKADFILDCDEKCLVKFECQDKGTTIIPGDDCKNKEAPKTLKSTYNECVSLFESYTSDWPKRKKFCQTQRGVLPVDDPATGVFHLPCEGIPPNECQLDVNCKNGGQLTVGEHCAGEVPKELFKGEPECMNTVKQLHDDSATRDKICEALTTGQTTSTAAATAEPPTGKTGGDAAPAPPPTGKTRVDAQPAPPPTGQTGGDAAPAPPPTGKTGVDAKPAPPPTGQTAGDAGPAPAAGADAGADATPETGADAAPAAGADAAPAAGADAAPAAGADATPAAGADATPAAGADGTPAAGADATPAAGADATPAEVAEATPAEVAEASSAEGAETTPAKEAGATPEKKAETTPSAGAEAKNKQPSHNVIGLDA